mmetsp:Transcript_36861/g.98176  ORF Transcript_36861/g.98176 Transcript_36861/m.98176 type:complete len:119 (-) Transcript_36861:206-562(-)
MQAKHTKSEFRSESMCPLPSTSWWNKRLIECSNSGRVQNQSTRTCQQHRSGRTQAHGSPWKLAHTGSHEVLPCAEHHATHVWASADMSDALANHKAHLGNPRPGSLDGAHEKTLRLQL